MIPEAPSSEFALRFIAYINMGNAIVSKLEVFDFDCPVWPDAPWTNDLPRALLSRSKIPDI